MKRQVSLKVVITVCALEAIFTVSVGFNVGNHTQEQKIEQKIEQNVTIEDKGENQNVLDYVIDENQRLKAENRQLEDEIDKLKQVTTNNQENISIASISNKMTKLSDLKLVDSGAYKFMDFLTDSYDNNYDGGYRFDASNKAYAVYSLKGNYSTFSAKIVATDDTGSKAEMKMIIYKGSDSDQYELVETIEHITKRTEQLEIGPYDISGARNLKIVTSNEGAYNNGFCYLVDAYVH